MKQSLLLLFACMSALSAKAQTVTYDIPIGQTIGLQQTSGDICSAPFTTEEAFQVSAGNSWGFTWTSTTLGTATSVEITLGFTIVEGGLTHPTSLNSTASFNVAEGTAKNCEASTILTWNVDPTNYNAGGLNTFMVDFSSSSTVSQVDNLPFPGDPFFRVTVNYTPCAAIDTTVTVNQNTITSNASNMSYQWIDCENEIPVSGATNVSYTPSATGNYAVIVTDMTTGCIDTSVCTQISLVSVENIEMGYAAIYPNPVQDLLSLELPEFVGKTTILIYDLSGKEVYRQNLSLSGRKALKINLSDLVSGHYQIKAISSDKVATGSFVKD